MAIEYDFITGFDFSSLSSITAAQTLQAFNQLAPLSNKGLVIQQSSAPDVANNARYARYLWIDTSANPYVTKYYDGAAWVTIAPGAAGITNSMIATAAVSLLASDGITYKITRAFNDANDVTKARYLTWLDANGKRLEIASLASVLATGSAFIAGVANLGIGGDNQILRMNGNAIGWEDFDNSLTDFSVALSKIVKGGASQVLITNGTGALGYADVINPIDNLEDAGATALQVLRKNAANTALEWGTPVFSKEFSFSAAAVVATGLNISQPHGLGVVPKIFRAVLVNITTEGAWVTNDEVDIASFTRSAGGDLDGRTEFFVGANSTTIYAGCLDSTALTGKRRDTGANFAVTAANWRMKVYAYA